MVVNQEKETKLKQVPKDTIVLLSLPFQKSSGSNDTRRRQHMESAGLYHRPAGREDTASSG